MSISMSQHPRVPESQLPILLETMGPPFFCDSIFCFLPLFELAALPSRSLSMNSRVLPCFKGKLAETSNELPSGGALTVLPLEGRRFRAVIKWLDIVLLD